MGKVVPFLKRLRSLDEFRRPKLPPNWQRYRRPRWARLSWGELRLMLLGGIFLGFCYIHATEQGAHWLARSGFVLGRSETVRWPITTRAIDGDTIGYHGQRIRLLGIDAPETAARCPAEAARAAAATRRLQQLLRAGPFEIEATLGRDRDRYGRLLRRLSRNGESLGAVMISEGHARAYSGGARQGWC